jgi:hypothetical protein
MWVPGLLICSFLKKKKSSGSRTWFDVDHSLSVSLFVPSTLSTRQRRMNLSSILRCWEWFQLMCLVSVGIHSCL